MRVAVIGRVSATVIAIVLVEAVVCGAAAAPAVGFWLWLTDSTRSLPPAARVALFSMTLVPSYVVFALGVMLWSSVATRLSGARSKANMVLRIADMEWPLLTWARYMAAIHVVRFFAGALFRGSPVWSMYLRLNGARIGRRVYVNTTYISDHNLLDLADDVVIGADVHISGHIVETGLVKTAGVRLGRGATIGLGSVIDIDVEIGERCQVGALSLVPKHSRLESGGVYVGIPAHRIK